MLRYFFVFFLVFYFSTACFSQKELSFFLYAGPSITNIHELQFGERVSYFRPERPFYEVNFHLGGGVEWKLNSNLNVVGSLNYERKGSAQDGFNKKNYTYGDFIQLPISIMVKPIKSKEIRFEFGVSTNYLINKKDLSISAIEFSTLEFTGVLGFDFKLYDNFYLGTRILEPFTDLNGNITSLSGESSQSTEKSQSFQFSLKYLL